MPYNNPFTVCALVAPMGELVTVDGRVVVGSREDVARLMPAWQVVGVPGDLQPSTPVREAFPALFLPPSAVFATGA